MSVLSACALVKRRRLSDDSSVDGVLRALITATDHMCRITRPVVVPAGLFGVRVRPGRDWDTSMDPPGCAGFTIAPTEADLNEWLEVALDPVSGPTCEDANGVPFRHCRGGVSL